MLCDRCNAHPPVTFVRDREQGEIGICALCKEPGQPCEDCGEVEATDLLDMGEDHERAIGIRYLPLCRECKAARVKAA